MAELIDLWWWWLTGVEKEVKNYSCGLGRNLKELAVKTLTFCYIEGRRFTYFRFDSFIDM